jgi:HK97 family phage prohead protease
MTLYVRALARDLSMTGDGHTLTVLAVPFDQPTTVSDGGPSYLEAFQRGAFDRTIRERGDRVRLLAGHDRGRLPIGKAVSLVEASDGLHATFQVGTSTAAEDALALVRDGIADSVSVGFRPVKHERRGDVLWRTEVRLDEVSLVALPAYDGARVLALRNAPDPYLTHARARMRLARARNEHNKR